MPQIQKYNDIAYAYVPQVALMWHLLAPTHENFYDVKLIILFTASTGKIFELLYSS